MLAALAAGRIFRRAGLPAAVLQLRCTADLAFEDLSTAAAATAALPATEGLPPTALVIHGLLGQGRNWRTWARTATKEASALTGRSWRTVLVDQRCHGGSAFRASLPPPHSLPSSAADMSRLSHQALGGRAPQVLIGHSMGGKVALEWIQQLATDDQGLGLPHQVWVLDSNVGSSDPNAASDVGRILQEVADIPLPVPSREWLMKRMTGAGFSEGLALWLGSNLVRHPRGGGLTWAFDIEGAADMFSSYGELSYWQLLEAPPRGVTINVVRAMRSDRWSDVMLAQLREAEHSTAQDDSCGQTRLHELPDAGHWLHVDNPGGLLRMLVPSFSAVPDSESGR